MSGFNDILELGKSLRKALKPAKRKHGKQVRHSPSIFIQSNETLSTSPSRSSDGSSPSFVSATSGVYDHDISAPKSTVSRSSSLQFSQYSLLPATSLSQLNLSNVHVRKATTAPEVTARSSSKSFRERAQTDHRRFLQTHQPQSEHFAAPSPRQSPSIPSLRIQPSDEDLLAQPGTGSRPLASLRSSHSSLQVFNGNLDLPSHTAGLQTSTANFKASRSTLRIPSSQDLHAASARLSTSSSTLTFDVSPPRNLMQSNQFSKRTLSTQLSPQSNRISAYILDNRVQSPTPTLRKQRRSFDLRSESESSSYRNSLIPDDHESSYVPSNSQPNHASIHSVPHFGSFCILDTYAPGCPVSAFSEDLRYNMQIGQQYYLNAQELMGGSMDMVTGTDADGNDTVHLGLFNPLVSVDNGKVRFVLVCLVNVTNFIKDAANESDADSIVGDQDEEDAQAITADQDEEDAQSVLEEEENGSEIEYNLNDISPMSSPDWDGIPTMPVEYFDNRLENAGRIQEEPYHNPEDSETSLTLYNTDLHAEDLLGGYILPSDKRKQRPSTGPASETRPSRARPPSLVLVNTTRNSSTLPTVPEASPTSEGGDIWLDLIENDDKRSQHRRSVLSIASTPRPPREPQPTPIPTPRHSSSRISLSSTKVSRPSAAAPSPLDDLLNTFMTSLQRLYSSIFVLALSPLSSAFYEIQFVSPALHASGSHVNDHLKHSPPELLKELGKKLDGGERFRMVVRWGDDGVEMQCYCVPVWGRRISKPRANSWICVLVDLEEGLLW